MRLFSGLGTAILLIILLSNLVWNASYNFPTLNQSAEAVSNASGGIQLPHFTHTGTNTASQPLSNLQLLSPPDPPYLAHAPCSATLPGGGSSTSGVINSGTITVNDIVVAGTSNYTVTGSGTVLKAHKIIVEGTGVFEVINGAEVILDQGSALNRGIALLDSAQLIMNGTFTAASNACILMNDTSTAQITTSTLYSPTLTLGLVLSGHAVANIDRGNSLGTLEVKGYSQVTVDSQEVSANIIHGPLIMRDHAEATVHGSDVTPTLVFNGTTPSVIDDSLGLHAFGNETRELDSSDLQVSWSLTLTASNVAAWNIVSEATATLTFQNSKATGNITNPLNIESYNNANTTFLANSTVSNVYAFNSSTIQVRETPGNSISTATVGSVQMFDVTSMSLQYIHKFAVGPVFATDGSHVTYMNSPANGTSFQITGTATFTLQNSTVIWGAGMLSGSSIFLAEDSHVLSQTSRPADVTVGSYVTAVFTNTAIASLATSNSAKVNVTNPNTPIGEVTSDSSSIVVIDSTGILRASTSKGNSQLTITNSSAPDIDATDSGTLTIDRSAVGIATSSVTATVNVRNSNVTTLLVCLFSCPSLLPATSVTVTNSMISTAIIGGLGSLSVTRTSVQTILAGLFGGTLSLTDSNVTSSLSFNGGSSSSAAHPKLILNGKINLNSLTIGFIQLTLDGIFQWNINRGNVASLVSVSGGSTYTVKRVFHLLYVDAKKGTPLANMEPYIPAKCPAPTSSPSPTCPYYDTASGSGSNGRIAFTVPFVYTEIATNFGFATQKSGAGGVSIIGLRTSTTDYNSSTIAFSDDSVVAMSATEVFAVPTFQPAIWLLMIAAILPVKLTLIRRRQRS